MKNDLQEFKWFSSKNSSSNSSRAAAALVFSSSRGSISISSSINSSNALSKNSSSNRRAAAATAADLRVLIRPDLNKSWEITPFQKSGTAAGNLVKENRYRFLTNLLTKFETLRSNAPRTEKIKISSVGAGCQNQTN